LNSWAPAPALVAAFTPFYVVWRPHLSAFDTLAAAMSVDSEEPGLHRHCRARLGRDAIQRLPPVIAEWPRRALRL
jgi:hypothetical protein